MQKDKLHEENKAGYTDNWSLPDVIINKYYVLKNQHSSNSF